MIHHDDLARAAALLDADPAYRVLRALPSLDQLPLGTPRGKVRTAVVLDCETTGLDWRTGHIIELAACPIQFDPYGRIVGIGRTCDWLEDPGYPLPDEIARLTGLSDTDLAGQRIDDRAVRDLIGSAELLVAHNAGFDAPWIEARFPAFAGKAWACSMREIDWAAQACDSRMLGHLLQARCGWFNGRHRADADVEALVALLASPLDDGRPAFAEMLLTASRPTFRVTAINAPFAVKDVLKARRYRWSSQAKAWEIELAEDALDTELIWLADKAHCRTPTTTRITWFQRHR